MASESKGIALSFYSRALRLMVLIAGVAVTLGSKSAAVVVPLLALATAANAYYQQVPSQFTFYREPPFVLWAAFAALAAVSAIWSLSPAASVTSGANLLLLLVSLVALHCVWPILPAETSRLIGTSLGIGFAIGAVFVLADVSTGGAIVVQLLALIDGTVRSSATLLVRENDVIVGALQAFSNWNVAGTTILFWPILLLVSAVAAERWRTPAMLACVALVAALTFASFHETSKLAFVVGSAIFLLARVARRAALVLLTTGFVLAVALILPITKLAHDTLRLHHASWVPDTVQARFVIWNYTADQVSGAPILGIGANATKSWKAPEGQLVSSDGHFFSPTVSSHSHNFFVQVWFELGFIGALLFGLAGASTLAAIARARASVQPYAIATAAASLVICSATWSMWHIWLASNIGLASAILALGGAIVDETRPPDRQRHRCRL